MICKMRLRTLIPLLFLSSVSFAQIALEEIKPEKKAGIPYDSSFISLEGIYNDEIKAGMVGQKVTILDVSYTNIFSSKEDLENRQNVGFSKEKDLENKTFEILAVEKDIYDVLVIKRDSSTYYWKLSGMDKYVFNGYLDFISKRLVGKNLVPLHNTNTLKALDNSELEFNGDKVYTVTKVGLTKTGLSYEVVLTLNDSIKVLFPTGSYDQRMPTVVKNPKKFNYLEISSNDYLKSKVIMVKEPEWEIFSRQHSRYLSSIRKKEVKVGMTEAQCRWAWGIPSKSRDDLAGYDKVLIYGDVVDGTYLMFNKGKLERIKQ